MERLSGAQNCKCQGLRNNRRDPWKGPLILMPYIYTPYIVSESPYITPRVAPLVPCKCAEVSSSHSARASEQNPHVQVGSWSFVPLPSKDSYFKAFGPKDPSSYRRLFGYFDAKG